MQRKCKGEDHVDVVPSPAGGDGLDVWGVVKKYDYACRNIPGSSGDVYVLLRGHREGLHMLPELATVMPSRLRGAANGGTAVLIRHRVLGIWTAYATLSFGAALQLADAIEAVVKFG